MSNEAKDDLSKREYSKEEREKAAEQAIRRVWTLHPSDKIIARTVKEMTDEVPREVPHTFLAKDVIDLQCELSATRLELKEARYLFKRVREWMFGPTEDHRQALVLAMTEWMERNASPSQSAETESR